MGYSVNPNGSDFTIVTDVLLHGVFATLLFVFYHTATLSAQAYLSHIGDYSESNPLQTSGGHHAKKAEKLITLIAIPA